MKTGLIAGTAAILLTLTACGSGDSSGSEGADGESYKMSLITGVRGEPFYTAMQCGAKDAAKRLNVELDIQEPEKFEPGSQIPLVNAAAAKNFDAILAVPTSASALNRPLKQISDSGTKVLILDTGLEDDSFAVSVISSDNEAGGALAATTMGELLGGKGKVITVNNPPGAGSLNLREKGFEAAATGEGLDYLGGQYSQDSAATASSNVSAVLAKDPDLAGIFAPENQNTQGAVAALKQAGKTGTVKVVAFDAQPGVVKQLRDGEVQALISQSPYDMGVTAVENAVKALKGDDIERNVTTELGVLTEDNIDAEDQAKFVYQGC